MAYLIIKSLHLIFVVTWFAGLFYIVRLFIYHTDTKELRDTEATILNKHLKIWEKKLWYIITWPSMILALSMGVTLFVLNPQLLYLGFMQVKIGFVLGLLIYHFICHKMYLQFQQDKAKYRSMFLRMWNEVATMFLVFIIFIIVLKQQLNWLYASLGFLALAVLLTLAIKWYKRLR